MPAHSSPTRWRRTDHTSQARRTPPVNCVVSRIIEVNTIDAHQSKPSVIHQLCHTSLPGPCSHLEYGPADTRVRVIAINTIDVRHEHINRNIVQYINSVTSIMSHIGTCTVLTARIWPNWYTSALVEDCAAAQHVSGKTISGNLQSIWKPHQKNHKCVAVCYMCVAVCCSVLQYVACVLQYGTVCCMCVAVLQHVSGKTISGNLQSISISHQETTSVLQWVTCVLQCVAVCCSVLHVCCSMVQCVGGVLQYRSMSRER